MKQHNKQILQDIVFVLISVTIATVAAKTGLITEIVRFFGGFPILGIFFAGLFFTSIFTTAPAIVLLGGFLMREDLLLVILVGALGAVIGDYFIFRFMRDRVADDIEYVIHATHEEKYISIFKKRIFRWMVPFIGALIIASPLPDELGIAMLGLSKTKSWNFVIISYFFNALGIALIGIVVRYAV